MNLDDLKFIEKVKSWIEPEHYYFTTNAITGEETMRLLAIIEKQALALEKCKIALKDDCFCIYQEYRKPMVLETECIYCKTSKEISEIIDT